MKIRLLAVTGALGFVLVAGAGAAWAELPTELQVKVPFDFIVGNKTMPAGEYTLSNPSPASLDVVEIRSADGLNAAIVQTEPASPKGSDYVTKSVLDFRKIDGKEYLASIWESGTGEGNVLSLPMTHRDHGKAVSQGK